MTDPAPNVWIQSSFDSRKSVFKKCFAVVYNTSAMIAVELRFVQDGFMKIFRLLPVLVLFVACENGDVVASDVCEPTPDCIPACGENTCGDDGCGCSCPDCDPGYKCREGQCVCAVCGGECGECPEIDWMQVEQGTFIMGCQADAATVDKICSADVLPPHRVSLSAFKVTRLEVTAVLYNLCVDSGACLLSDLNGYNSTGSNPNMSGHPINYVTWKNAESYCTWIGGRLGTEAEWEYAARDSDGRRYPWGNTGPSCSMAWTAVDSCAKSMTHDVGTMPNGKSPWGIEDMAGNVAEWVADHCSLNSYDGAPTDGSVWTKEPNSPCRVVRGGGFAGGVEEVRSFNRQFTSGNLAMNDVGIRCFQ